MAIGLHVIRCFEKKILFNFAIFKTKQTTKKKIVFGLGLGGLLKCCS